MGAQPAFEQRLCRDDDMRFWVRLLAVGAVRACRLAILPEDRVEPQAIKGPKAFVTLGEIVDVQLGRPEAAAVRLIESRRTCAARSVLAASSAFRAASSAFPAS